LISKREAVIQNIKKETRPGGTSSRPESKKRKTRNLEKKPTKQHPAQKDLKAKKSVTINLIFSKAKEGESLRNVEKSSETTKYQKFPLIKEKNTKRKTQERDYAGMGEEGGG